MISGSEEQQQGGVFIEPILRIPLNGYTDIIVNPVLEWSKNPHIVSSYQVQVATDSAFSNIVVDKSNVKTEALQVALLQNTTYIWRVRLFGAEGGPTNWSPVFRFTTGTTTGLETLKDIIPNDFSLSQNYPNPFNPSTVIRYALPSESKVTLTIYNLLGQAINELVNDTKSAGYHEVNFKANNLASGIYFYRISATSIDGKHNSVDTKKLILLK